MAVKHIVDFQSFKERDFYGKINLIQIGRLVCEKGHVVAKHTHLNWFELTSIVEGEGYVVSGDSTVAVKKGDIFLSFPCEVHGITSSESNPLTYDHFSFYTDNVEYKEWLERVMANYANPKKRSFKSYLVRELLDGCINTLLSATEFQKDHLTASFSLIVLEILKIFKARRGESLITDAGMQTPEKMCMTVKNYIDTHLFSIGSLSELASLCGYNYSYLSYLFRKNTGLTLSDYYKERRFESAKLMISENRLKIGEISNLLGYNSVYAFSKAFKDEFGVSPKNYYKSLLMQDV